MQTPSARNHVTSRGDRREAIYGDEQDRADWLAALGEGLRPPQLALPCPLRDDQPYHVVVETPQANLSKGMRQLNGVCTQQFNRRHGLVGHLFHGCFKGILVERDAYLLELSRYAVLNLVRAGMVSQAGEWGWSSYRAMVGMERAPAWLVTDWVLGQLGPDRALAQTRYAAFVAAGVADRATAIA